MIMAKLEVVVLGVALYFIVFGEYSADSTLIVS